MGYVDLNGWTCDLGGVHRNVHWCNLRRLDIRQDWAKESSSPHHALLLYFLVAQRRCLERPRSSGCSLSDGRRPVIHDRRRDHIHHRNVPSEEAWCVPGMGDGHRIIWHSFIGPRCQPANYAYDIRMAIRLRIRRTGHIHAPVRRHARRIAALVRGQGAQ